MNWREERDHSDYEARERAMGHREVTEPRDTSMHAQVAAALRTLPEFHQPAPLQLIPPPAAQNRMTRTQLAVAAIQCPQCHAAAGERCTNYSGTHCAPHSARNAAATLHRATPAPVATAAELPPVPPAAAAAAERATARRIAVVATAREETLSALDRAVEQLVREHSSGAVIDAAWSAAHRIFQPHGGAR